MLSGGAEMRCAISPLHDARYAARARAVQRNNQQDLCRQTIREIAHNDIGKRERIQGRRQGVPGVADKQGVGAVRDGGRAGKLRNNFVDRIPLELPGRQLRVTPLQDARQPVVYLKENMAPGYLQEPMGQGAQTGSDLPYR